MAISNCSLIDCNEVVPDLYTTVLLTPAISSLSWGVSVIVVAEYPNTCFRIIKPPDIIPPALPYTITNVYTSSNQATNCAQCVASIKLYLLEDCLDVAAPIYSFTDLDSVVGKVIKLEGDDNICRSVSVVIYNEQTTEDVVILTNDADVPQIFNDCTCCLPAPEPAPTPAPGPQPTPAPSGDTDVGDTDFGDTDFGDTDMGGGDTGGGGGDTGGGGDSFGDSGSGDTTSDSDGDYDPFAP